MWSLAGRWPDSRGNAHRAARIHVFGAVKQAFFEGICGQNMAFVYSPFDSICNTLQQCSAAGLLRLQSHHSSSLTSSSKECFQLVSCCCLPMKAPLETVKINRKWLQVQTKVDVAVEATYENQIWFLTLKESQWSVETVFNLMLLALQLATGQSCG